MFKPAAVASVFLTLFLVHGARADVIGAGGNFNNAQPGESSAYAILAIAAVVCVIGAMALVVLGDMKRRKASKESVKNNNRK